MDLTKIGCVQEARFMAEILIANPTLENFNRYRIALVNIRRVFDCELEEATHKVTTLIESQI